MLIISGLTLRLLFLKMENGSEMASAREISEVGTQSSSTDRTETSFGGTHTEGLSRV
jgi:hypothetical protein